MLLCLQLNNISMEALTDVGRVYGDGLYKLEPKELAHVSINDLLSAVPELQECIERV